MSPRAPGICRHPDCDVAVPTGQDCPRHPRSRRPDDRRPTPTERGYDAKWKRNVANFLRQPGNETCVDCPAPARAGDHDPVSRRELIERGDPHPDAWHHLRPRCVSCHNRRSATLRK